MSATRTAARAVFWLVPGKQSDSPLFGGAVDRAFGEIERTQRNANTVRRLVDRFG